MCSYISYNLRDGGPASGNTCTLKLRPMLLDETIPADNGIDKLDHKAQIAIICRKLSEKRDQLRKEGGLEKFLFGFKIIYCTPRSIPKEKMRMELEDCLKLKIDFPDLICGFDLIGAEDRPNHVGFYADLLDAFAKTCKELDLSNPFMFHAGETLIDIGGSHNPDKSNLYDSLLLNAKRIGHGYSLLKHPHLVKKYKEQNIYLEFCKRPSLPVGRLQNSIAFAICFEPSATLSRSNVLSSWLERF